MKNFSLSQAHNKEAYNHHYYLFFWTFWPINKNRIENNIVKEEKSSLFAARNAYMEN